MKKLIFAPEASRGITQLVVNDMKVNTQLPRIYAGCGLWMCILMIYGAFIAAYSLLRIGIWVLTVPLIWMTQTAVLMMVSTIWLAYRIIWVMYRIARAIYNRRRAYRIAKAEENVPNYLAENL